MICRHCRQDLPDDAFTASGAARAQCRDCKAAANRDDYRAQTPAQRRRTSGQPDRDDWARLRKPWPWSPDEKPFAY